MHFKLIIDENKDEEVVATVHASSSFTEKLEALVMQHTGEDRVTGYTEDGWKMIPIADIECVTVLDGKTYVIDKHNVRYRVKQRLYELEAVLPAWFIRINKSALANENRLERFSASFNGAVDAVFQCGYKECVSRRCFAEIKRRYGV